MKYFFDTEFDEDGRTIELISIGIVAEDGREYYAVALEWDPDSCNDWVKAHVIPQLPPVSTWKKRSVIAREVLEFVTVTTSALVEGVRMDVPDKPEFWGYYADYDWVVLCQLYGRMIDLPRGWPMYCRDLKQWCDDLGNPELPTQGHGEHNALEDARWNRQLHAFLTLLEMHRRGS